MVLFIVIFGRKAVFSPGIYSSVVNQVVHSQLLSIHQTVLFLFSRVFPLSVAGSIRKHSGLRSSKEGSCEGGGWSEGTVCEQLHSLVLCSN